MADDTKSGPKVVDSPKDLSAKVPRSGGISLEEAVAKSNAALESVIEEHKPDVSGQLDEIAQLHTSYQANQSADVLDQIFKAVHKLRGDAVTLGYPLISRIGSSFCRYLLEKGKDVDPHPVLVAEHINAMIAAYKEAEENTADATGDEVAAALEQTVSKLVAG
ncbi:MAG TPA: hypothetical protein DCS82_06485 [Rhodospirillaceae bacterium]|nr:hypothetical protein [Rhodospirillaceae bacterium]HAT35345.1 hypothetical protein [Rhodospirillaceae bacterium]|tara:strand:- start:7 stop:495 length:489 start_codon:yes stop_codon:yes gene_type:complete